MSRSTRKSRSNVQSLVWQGKPKRNLTTVNEDGSKTQFRLPYGEFVTLVGAKSDKGNLQSILWYMGTRDHMTSDQLKALDSVYQSVDRLDTQGETLKTQANKDSWQALTDFIDSMGYIVPTVNTQLDTALFVDSSKQSELLGLLVTQAIACGNIAMTEQLPQDARNTAWLDYLSQASNDS